MRKTHIPKKKDIKQKWFIVDADGKVLGRLAAKVAAVIRGKHKPAYTPHMDTGDSVVVINAAKVIVTGKKLEEKTYGNYSGYPGGLRTRTLKEVLKTRPAEVIERAVRGMLPKGPLGKKLCNKLKVCAGDKHNHTAQKPEKLEI